MFYLGQEGEDFNKMNCFFQLFLGRKLIILKNDFFGAIESVLTLVTA